MRHILLTSILSFWLLPTYAQEVPVPHGDESDFKNIYALIIGIGEYKNPNVKRLEFADDDAELFRKYLLEAYDGRILPKNIHFLTNEKATQAAIAEKINKLQNDASKDDLIIFYFSGHGASNESNPNSTGYLMAYDANPPVLSGGGAYPVQWLDEVLNGEIAGVKQATTICILDACRAGNSQPGLSKSYLGDPRINTQPGNNRVIKLLSCRSDQKSMENEKWCKGHGVFTYYLIKGLLNASGDNAPIDISKLDDFVTQAVQNATDRSQKPQFYYADKKMLPRIRKGIVTQDFECFFDKPVKAVPSTVRIVYDEKTTIENQLNESQKRHYRSFTNALNTEKYLEPKGDNAHDYYEMLKIDGVTADLLDQIKGQWKAKFQDYGQSLIIDYINEAALHPYTDYERAASMLKLCLNESSEKDPGYNLLKAKQLWLTAYSMSRRLQLGIDKISQNQMRQRRQKIIPILREAIRLDPNAAYLYHSLGFNLENVGDDQQAEAAYREAMRLAPRWTYPRNNLTNVVSSMDQKIKLLNECIELNKEMYLAYANLAFRYRTLKDTLQCRINLDKALELAQKYKEDDDDLEYIYRQYAQLYLDRQMRDKAELYFRQAVDAAKRNGGIESRIERLEYYCDRGDYNLANTECDEIQKINSNDARVYYWRGYLNEQKKDYPTAIKLYDQSLKYDSLYVNPYFRMASIYYDSDSLSRAENALKSVIRINPAIENAWTLMGNIYNKRKQSTQAMSYYSKALELNSRNAYTYESIAWSYELAGQYEKAEQYALKSIDSSKVKAAYLYNRLGEIYYYQGKYRQGLGAYRKAVQTDNNNDGAWTGLSDCYQALEQPDSAIYFIDQSIIRSFQRNKQSPEQVLQAYQQDAKNNDRLAYYKIGFLYENGKGVKADLQAAGRWYAYAHEMGVGMATSKLIKFYESGQLKSASGARQEISRLQNGLKKSRKKITLPCNLTNGTKRAIPIYITDYFPVSGEPLAHEITRLREVYQASLAPQAIDAFGKLYKLAIDNKVSFVDLCVYALEQTQTNYLATALDRIKSRKTDSLSYFMGLSVTEQLKVSPKQADKAVEELINKLRQGVDNEGWYYYALGYLYEKKDSPEWSKAEKWYQYAFQTGFQPAYYWLAKRYRQLSSSSSVNWVADNYNRGVRRHTITGQLPGGLKKSLSIYFQDFPQNPSDPIIEEEERLKDVYGATVSEADQSTFKSLYSEAQRTGKSFIELSGIKLNSTERIQTATTSTAARYAQEGDELYNKNKYADALLAYQKAIDAATDADDRADFYAKRGNAELFSDQYDKAITSYQESIQLAPRGSTYYLLGYTYMTQKNLPKATEAYKKAVELRPTNASFQLMLGRMYSDQQQYSEAIPVLNNALSLEPGNTRTMNTLALALIYSKRYNEGIDLLKKAMGLNSAEAKIYCYNIACAYALQNKSSQALQYLEEAIVKYKYDDYKGIQADPDLTSIRDTGPFKALMVKYFTTK